MKEHVITIMFLEIYWLITMVASVLHLNQDALDSGGMFVRDVIRKAPL